jgi:YesN/AraC family two-component response regulator
MTEQCSGSNSACRRVRVEADVKTRDRIVIVEDEAYSVMSLEMVLRMLGYEVVGTAASGERALEIIGATRPDLVMVDVRLNGKLTGLETIERMRAFHDASVVLMTGYRDPETLERIKRCEHAACLFKPFMPYDVEAALEQVLGTKFRSQESGVRSQESGGLITDD